MTAINIHGSLNISLDPASLSDAGAILPTDQVVIYRNGMPLRTTVAILTGAEVEPEPSGFLLVPTGATESADGVFQRFVPDATDPLGYPAYYAELPPQNWSLFALEVQFKWPDLTVDNDAVVIFFSSGHFNNIENAAGDENDATYVSLQIARTVDGGAPSNVANFDLYKFGADPSTPEPITLTPNAGDIATLTFTRTQVMLSVGGMAQIYTIPESTFAPTSTVNVVAKVESAVLPLSIKVAPATER